MVLIMNLFLFSMILTFAHMHFASAFPNNTHDLGVRDCRSHTQRALIQGLKMIVSFC